MVLDEHAQKMSKSKPGNHSDPNQILDQFYSDALRIYLSNSPAMRGEPLKFNEAHIGPRPGMAPFNPFHNRAHLLLPQPTPPTINTSPIFYPDPKSIHFLPFPTPEAHLSNPTINCQLTAMQTAIQLGRPRGPRKTQPRPQTAPFRNARHYHR